MARGKFVTQGYVTKNGKLYLVRNGKIVRRVRKMNYRDLPCMSKDSCDGKAELGHGKDCTVVGPNSDPKDIATFGLGWHHRTRTL